jgi:polysaccharide biosynthesis transport protein
MASMDGPAAFDPRTYLRRARQRWWVPVVAVAVAVVFALAFLSTTEPVEHRAAVEVGYREPAALSTLGITGGSTRSSLIAREAVANSVEVIAEVRDVVGAEPRLRARAVGDRDVLVLSARSRDRHVALAAAERFAEVFTERHRALLAAEHDTARSVIVVAESRVASELARLRQERAAAEAAVAGDDPDRELELRRIAVDHESRMLPLELQLEQYSAMLATLTLSDELLSNSAVFVLSSPVLTTTGSSTMRNVLLAAVFGLILGAISLFVVEYLDTSVRSAAELEQVSGLTTLALLPRFVRTADETPALSSDEPDGSSDAEPYRALRTSVEFLRVDRPIRTLLITSAEAGAGSTVTAVNLAVMCGRAGMRTVLVDCDLRQPRVHDVLGLDNTIGFTSVLLGDATLDVAARPIAAAPALAVLTSGPAPPDPAELIGGAAARSLLGELADQADLVIIDSPSVLGAPDAVALAGMVDAVTLIVAAARTDRSQVRRAVEQLDLVRAPLVGTVLNEVAPVSLARRGAGQPIAHRSTAVSHDASPREWGALPPMGLSTTDDSA